MICEEHKFLFILSPPYCGSTLLNDIISTSKNVSSNNYLNTREGQTLPEVKQFMFKKKAPIEGRVMFMLI